MVSLVALNTIQLAHGKHAGAVAVSFGISFLWWQNSSRHRLDSKWAGLVYAAGAAAGTATGILIGNWG
jgi:hypothetical protein